MRSQTAFTFLTVLSAGIAITSASSASPVYPGTVQSELSLDAAPLCTACHTSASGGPGTATQPLAESLKTRGLVGGGNTQSLIDALDQLVVDGVDSDGDGTLDVDELLAGTDPNADGGTEPAAGDDTSSDSDDGGCSVSTAPASGGQPWAMAGLLAGALVLSRRRRRA